MTKALRISCLSLLLALGVACGEDTLSTENPYPLTPLTGDRNYVRDQYGRYVFFHGINVSGGDKVPATEENGVPSYVGKPFPLSTARAHFAKLRRLGFNSIRLLILWEGIEPTKRGVYDEAYLSYLREIVKAANEFDIYVLLEMHQDVFSRHLAVKYNQHPKTDNPGMIADTILALLEPYDDVVSGNGAPRWVVEACLQEKNLSSPNWGIPRLLSGITGDELSAMVRLYLGFTGGDPTAGGSAPTDDWIGQFLLNRPDPFPPNETSDLLPFSPWPVAHALSVDVARTYACFFAGDRVFPGLEKDGVNIKDYLQEAYTNAWKAVAEKVKDLPNVMGYDVFNEPSGNFLVLAAVAAVLRAGVVDAAQSQLVSMLGPEMGAQLYEVLRGFRLFPPDTSPETLKLWGLDKLDTLEAISVNYAFDDKQVRPLMERVGREIQVIDPDAVIYVERSINPSTLFSGLGISPGGGFAGMFDSPMTRPDLPHPQQMVFTPHWYADIYPFASFIHTPRTFTVEEVRYRDYQAGLVDARKLGDYSLGNMPVVFSEFGVFFDFNGIAQAQQENYAVSSHMLNSYYEAFEKMFQSKMLWDYCPENSYTWGDLWNHEDLSIIDPYGRTRSELAWSRPFAKTLAGKPLSTHFYSDMHYFDPDKDTPLPLHEFEVVYASKETSAPSEIFVPDVQYPAGFYVWVSDGHCFFDRQRRTLYHYPEDDHPDATHSLRLQPPLPNQQAEGWKYFFKGDQVINH